MRMTTGTVVQFKLKSENKRDGEHVEFSQQQILNMDTDSQSVIIYR